MLVPELGPVGRLYGSVHLNAVPYRAQADTERGQKKNGRGRERMGREEERAHGLEATKGQPSFL